MNKLFNPLPINEEQQQKILEMARIMFKMDHVMIWRERNLISLNAWTLDNMKGENIGWVEFILFQVAPKLNIEPLWTNNIFKDLFEEATHPVDYLYIEYLKEYQP